MNYGACPINRGVAQAGIKLARACWYSLETFPDMNKTKKKCCMTICLFETNSMNLLCSPVKRVKKILLLSNNWNIWKKKNYKTANVRTNVNPKCARRNHCSSRKPKSITYPECVYTAFVIQHAMRMRLVWLYHIFPHYHVKAWFSSNWKQKVCFGFLYSFFL